MHIAQQGRTVTPGFTLWKQHRISNPQQENVRISSCKYIKSTLSNGTRTSFQATTSPCLLQCSLPAEATSNYSSLHTGACIFWNLVRGDFILWWWRCMFWVLCGGSAAEQPCLFEEAPKAVIGFNSFFCDLCLGCCFCSCKEFVFPNNPNPTPFPFTSLYPTWPASIWWCASFSDLLPNL